MEANENIKKSILARSAPISNKNLSIEEKMKGIDPNRTLYNRQKIKEKQNPLLPYNVNATLRSKSSMAVKNSITKQHKKDNLNRIDRGLTDWVDQEELLMEDKKFKKIYQELCMQLKSVPKWQPERIKELKQVDPIFAKRYRQFTSAKACNKAPLFDCNDNLLAFKLPKSALSKKKENIADSFRNEKQRPNSKLYKNEIKKINLKVKKFMKELDSV
jgi:hypothetical protein